MYGHVNRALAREGQEVRAGEKIAEMGSRGNSTGPHLHLEIWDPDGNKVNPSKWLPAAESGSNPPARSAPPLTRHRPSPQ